MRSNVGRVRTTEGSGAGCGYPVEELVGRAERHVDLRGEYVERYTSAKAGQADVRYRIPQNPFTPMNDAFPGVN